MGVSKTNSSQLAMLALLKAAPIVILVVGFGNLSVLEAGLK
jgi:hypothetical protein